MIKEVRLPDLGEGIESAEVSEVSMTPGETIMPEDTILVLESDKASMEIPSELEGEVKEVLVSVGEEIAAGQLLIKVEVSDAKKKSKKAAKEEAPEETSGPKEETQDHASNEPPPADVGLKENIFASPGVRRLARELGINLRIIQGTGPKGRITKDDLNGHIKLQMATASGKVSPPQLEVDFSKWGEVETLKLTRIKRITGERLEQAWQTIPHVTQFDEADITELESLRKKMKKTGLEKNIKVTILPFLIKAASTLLKEMPEFNSSLDHTGENLVFKKYYHIGIAVDTPTGLVVPVIRDVDKKSIFELSEELMDLSQRARKKELKPNEMKGGTFTVSSLGGIGGTGFTPIVNPPEVAIMGISKSSWKPVYDNNSNKTKSKLMMPFSLSYDHRVIDGAAAANFSSRFTDVLKDVHKFEKYQ